MLHFTTSSQYAIPVERLFAWHERPGAFQRLCPPEPRVTIVRQDGGLQDGAEVHLQIRQGCLAQDWLLRHIGYQKNEQFCEVSIRGPVRSWYHQHCFQRLDEAHSLLEDKIDYSLAAGSLLEPILAKYITRKLQRVFAYRQRVLTQDLVTHRVGDFSKPLTVAVTGATGFIGSALVPYLQTQGHQVLAVSRDPRRADIFWDPEHQSIAPEAFAGCDAVIHLAGEGIGGLWTARKRQRLYRSRVYTTQRLVEALTALDQPPRVFIGASAIGYYGTHRDGVLAESSAAGAGFLAGLCRDWEAAASSLRSRAVRVVYARMGVVLCPGGGALGQAALPFKLGLGGRVGNGGQQMSWIAMDDLITGLHALMINEAYEGPVNLVAPTAVTNRLFTACLASALHRPAVWSVPAFLLRKLPGGAADETLLSSLAVQPKKLLEHDFKFRYTELPALFDHYYGD